MNILFIIFNRPDITRRVFEEIRRAKPAALFIAADGPRSQSPDEKEKCEEARKITEAIDWPCDVKRKYSPENQGCKIGVSSAITWFFENVEAGIILEDDCLPDPSFFPYCQELLLRYKDNDNIKMISGDNFQQGRIRGGGSYYFSRLPTIWGWATWKRAWNEFDLEMKGLDENTSIPPFWLSHFKHIRDRNIDTWDAQWTYAVMKSGGLSIVPNANLIENLGFTSEATHTKTKPSFVLPPLQALAILRHPSSISADDEADAFQLAHLYKRSPLQRFRQAMKRFLGGSK